MAETLAEDVLHALTGEVQCAACLQWKAFRKQSHTVCTPYASGLAVANESADRWNGTIFCFECWREVTSAMYSSTPEFMQSTEYWWWAWLETPQPMSWKP